MNGGQWWLMLDRAGFRAASLMLSTLWQSSILLAAAGLLAHALRRRRASVRQAILAAAVLASPLIPLLGWAARKSGTPQAPIPVMPTYPARVLPVPPEGVAPPLMGSPSIPDAPPSVEAEHTVAGQPEQVQPPEPFSLLHYPWAVVLLAYVSGASLLLLLVLVGRLRIRRWARRSRVVTDPRVLGIFRAGLQRLGLTRDVVIVESPGVRSPLTVGTLHPVIILPSGLRGDVSDEEMNAIALHELAHVKRCDSALLALLSLVRAALFFHPLVWLACRQVSTLAESACDDAVLDGTGQPVAYARMLTRLAEQLPRHALTMELSAGIVWSKTAFLRRIEAILSDRRDRLRRLSRAALAATVLAAIVSIALALGLPLAQKEQGPAGATPPAPEGAGTEPADKPAPKGASTLPGAASAPVRLVSADEPRGSYRWRVHRDKPVVLGHGWYSSIDGQVKESAGGVVGKAEAADIDLRLTVSRLGDMLVLDCTKGNGDDWSGQVTRTAVPEGATLRTAFLADPQRLNEARYQTLWRGDFLKDGKVIKSVVYVARLAQEGSNCALMGQNDPVRQVAPLSAPEGAGTQPAGSKLEFRIAPKLSGFDNNMLATYRDWLKAGAVGFWWLKTINGRPVSVLSEIPEYAWLPIAGELTNAPGLVTGECDGRKYVLVSDKSGQTMLPGEGKDTWGLAKVYATTDSLNRPVLGFELDDRGAELFAALTKANINNALGIVVNGRVVSAPVLKTPLGKQGMVTGRFTEQEVEALVQALKAGMPPASQAATQPAPKRAGTQAAAWGAPKAGLRCRWLDVPGPVTVGSRPRVSVEVQNSLKEPILWDCTSEVSWGLAVVPTPASRPSGYTMPKFAVKMGAGVRLAKGKEVREALGVAGRLELKDGDRLPGYYYFAPGASLILTGELPWALNESGEVLIASEVARYWPDGGRDYGEEGRMLCPVLELMVVRAGLPTAATQPATRPTGLPGSGTDDIRAYLRGGEVVAVMQATEHPRPEALEGGARVVSAQEFKVVEFLGDRKLDPPVHVLYRYNTGTERAIAKGQQVLWVLGHAVWHPDRSVQWGLKAQEDTAENRRSLVEQVRAAAKRPGEARWKDDPLLLPGARVALAGALKTKNRVMARCRALEIGLGVVGEAGVIHRQQRYAVLDVLAGKSEAKEVVISFIQFDLPCGRERRIAKGDEVIWIADASPAGAAGQGQDIQWRGVKALLDVPANRAALGLPPDATVPPAAAGAATQPAAEAEGTKAARLRVRVYRLDLPAGDIEKLKKSLAESPKGMPRFDQDLRRLGVISNVGGMDLDVQLHAGARQVAEKIFATRQGETAYGPLMIAAKGQLEVSLAPMKLSADTPPAGHMTIEVALTGLKEGSTKAPALPAETVSPFKCRYDGQVVLGRPVQVFTQVGPDKCVYLVWVRLTTAGASGSSRPAPEGAGTRPAEPTTRLADASRLARAKRLAAEADISALGTALDTFKVDAGRYPTTKEGLDALISRPAGLASWRGPYVRALPSDPWDQPYEYLCPGQHNTAGFDLSSRGPDGQAGTDDDVRNWSAPRRVENASTRPGRAAAATAVPTGPTASLGALIYELRLPADRAAKLDTAALAKAAGAADFQKALRALGETKLLYRVEQGVSLGGDRIVIGKRVPVVVHSAVGEDGQTINTIAYQDTGAIFAISGKPRDGGSIDMRLDIELAVLSEGTTVVPGFRAPATRKVKLGQVGVVQIGKPSVSAAAASANDDKAVMYVARVVLGEVHAGAEPAPKAASPAPSATPAGPTGASSKGAGTQPAAAVGAAAEGLSCPLKTTIYELRLPPERVPRLDATGLTAAAATPAGLEKALADLGQAKVLYRMDQTVRLSGDRITIVNKVPVVVGSRITGTGHRLNLIQYESVGAVLTIAGKLAGEGAIDADLGLELSAATDSAARVTAEVPALVLRRVNMAHKGPLASGRPVVIVSVDAASANGAGKAVAYVARIVLGKPQPTAQGAGTRPVGAGPPTRR